MTATPPLSTPVSVDYTSRDYYSLRDQVIARIQARIPSWTGTDPADFGVALAEAFAYVSDVISYYIDRTANEAFITTATQRDTLLAIAASYGYTPVGYRNALVTLTFSNTSDVGVLIPSGTVVSGDVSVNDTVTRVYFTTWSDLTVPAAVDETPGTNTVGATEGESVILVSADANANGALIGTSTGAPGMTFQLPENPVAEGTVEVYVQDGASYSKWTQVQHLLDYGVTDTVFSTYSDENNSVFVQFGDGVSGAIPVAYSEIRALYTVGGGVVGNVSPDTLTTIHYVPGLSEAETTALQAVITVNNTSAAFGGSDPESDAEIRQNAPLALRALNRAVTLTDYKSLALQVTGIGKANATASTWTSVTTYIAPSRNAADTDLSPGLDDLGNPTAEWTSLKADLEAFYQDKLLIGTTVSIVKPTYVDVVLGIQYVQLPQYTTAEVEAALKAAVVTSFGYVNLDFQQTIYPQDIEFYLNQVPGIKVAKVTGLHRVGDTGLLTLVGAADEIFRFQEANISLGAL